MTGERIPCPAKDGRNWPCHFQEGHMQDHAFDDAQEMAILRRHVKVLEEHNQYFRDSPNLAFYHQALRDKQKLDAIRAEVANQKSQDDTTQWGDHGRWHASDAIERVLDRVEPELPKWIS